MSMAKRAKRLGRRVHTYEQLEAILVAWKKGRRKNTYLYGGVMVRGTYPDRNAIEIAYATDRTSVPLARVYRAADGDSVYWVLPPPDLHRKRKDPLIYTKTTDIWKRYVRVFTPYDEPRVFSDSTLRYLVSGGTATHVYDMPGYWKSFPRGTVALEPNQWASEFLKSARKYHTVPRRARAFATRLRKALEDGPPAVTQVFDPLHGDRAHIPFVGATLHVCTAPTKTQRGKRLLVKVGPYNDEGRLHHHVDGDYALKHCQFFAVEEGKSWREGGMRWKCSKDAISGIKEWVLGDIYIPGPG
jgi:hypothetical protein